MIERLALFAFGWVAAVFVRLLGATWRLEVEHADPAEADAALARANARGPHRSPAQLGALFHEALLPAAWLFRGTGHVVAVSRSRDGSLVAAVLRSLGYGEPARGSSSRGGSVALIGLVRRLEAGTTVAVLVDGPRGPAGVAKPGIAALSRLTATPITPVAFAARPALRLASWDRTLVPLPFAKVVCVFGASIPPSPAAIDDEDETTARAVQIELERLAAKAAARAADSRERT